MKRALFFMLFICSCLFAEETAYDKYFEEAASYYKIDPLLLKKICKIESNFDVNAIGVNANKTKDYGLMQINSAHLPILKRYGITEKNIMEPRINIYVGAALLDFHLRTHGKNFDALGFYHSATPKYKEAWLSRLAKEFKKGKSSVNIAGIELQIGQGPST